MHYPVGSMHPELQVKQILEARHYNNEEAINFYIGRV